MALRSFHTLIGALLIGTAPLSASLLMARAEAAAPRPAHQRLLPLHGGQNFRDLGGYRTKDGRSVRWGVLFRSGSMHYLTPADFAYLAKLGISTVCDFRTTQERRTAPVNWPGRGVPEVLADAYDMDSTDLLHLRTVEEARVKMAVLYRRFPTILNVQYRRMFSELLASRAPLAFNCSAGKDRTGVAAAMLLTALGVPRETVIQDYLLTNRYLKPDKLWADQNASVQLKGLSPAILRAVIAADRRYIEALFRSMDTHRGGAEGFLRDEMGLSAADLAKLRQLYTE
jgi:protein-tyrosine phosphatase